MPNWQYKSGYFYYVNGVFSLLGKIFQVNESVPRGFNRMKDGSIGG